MSDNIDYSELDKAVNAAISARNAANVLPKAEQKPVSRAPQKPAAKPAHRGVVMDFAPRRTSHPVAKAPVRKAPVAPAKPVAPKPVARPAAPARPVAKPAPAVAARKSLAAPISRLVSRPAAKPVAKTVARPTVAPAKPVSKPVMRPTPTRPMHPAQAQARPAAKPAAPAAKPAEKAVTAPTPVLKKREAPNGNNYSLGGRSPFVLGTKVEKRPLGKNIPETSTSALRSTHNIYSQKSPTRATENAKKHVITQDPAKKSGWIWTLIVLGVIAAGGGLGYLTYLLVFAH